jgi:hypothetical protein
MRTLLILAAALLAIFVLTSVSRADSWFTETVSYPDTWGIYTSLALDGSQNPRISCASADLSQNTALLFTEKNGGVWSIDTVVTAFPDAGYRSSLVLDASGNPHLSYSVIDNGTNAKTLYYATRSSGVWSSQIVDGTATAGEWTSIALDASGNPHICYIDEVNAQLKYASLIGGVWSTVIVDAGPDVGGHVSLVIDPVGNAQMSYTGATGALKYAKDSYGTWASFLVDDMVIADHTAIAVTASNVAKIAYTNRSPGEGQIKFASGPG